MNVNVRMSDSMFICCFDQQYANTLKSNESLKLFKESNIGDTRCWIFVMDNKKDDLKSNFTFNDLDMSKCIVSNRMTF